MIKNLIKQIESLEKGPLWIYETYTSKLTPINEENAFTRPSNTLNSVAEIIDHVIFWRSSSIAKLNQREIAIKDWTDLNQLQQKGWDTILKEFQQSTKDLVAVLKDQPDSFLSEAYYDSDYKEEFTKQFLIEGVIQHDLYHLGQLGIIITQLQMNANN